MEVDRESLRGKGKLVSLGKKRLVKKKEPYKFRVGDVVELNGYKCEICKLTDIKLTVKITRESMKKRKGDYVFNIGEDLKLKGYKFRVSGEKRKKNYIKLILRIIPTIR